GEMLWSRRSVFLAILLGGPVALALLIRVLIATALGAFRINGSAVGGTAIFGLMIWLLCIRFILPILGVFYGTSTLAEEGEDETVAYLISRPIPRTAGLLDRDVVVRSC